MALVVSCTFGKVGVFRRGCVRRSGLVWVVGLLLGMAVVPAHGSQVRAKDGADKSLDRDLMEISVPGLERLYAKRTYTVTEVTRWYLDRIARYDGTYRALLRVDAVGALRRAAEEDAAPKGAMRGALWGVPIVVKANTSVKGWVTS